MSQRATTEGLREDQGAGIARILAVFLAAFMLAFSSVGHRESRDAGTGFSGADIASQARFSSVARRLASLLPVAEAPVRKAQGQRPQPPKFAGPDDLPVATLVASLDIAVPDETAAPAPFSSVSSKPSLNAAHRARAPPASLFAS